MARQEIDIGVEGNDGTGDSIRESFRKVNENFTEIYAVFGEGETISFTRLGDTPDTLGGQYKIPRVNSGVTALEFVDLASDTANGEDSDSVLISNDNGKIILSTAFRRLSQDQNPVLGQPLNARGSNEVPVTIALGNNSISEEAVAQFNNTHPGLGVTIDDLVISKGYADQRYVTSDLPIRLNNEPSETSQYTLTIDEYTNGNIVVNSHGFDRTINGTPYVFDAEDTNPAGLISGQTYFLRYYNPNQLSVHTTKEDATIQSQTDAELNRIFVSGSIAADDTHAFVDAGFDDTLEGNWLSNIPLPRKSVVRRQGDTMTGPLILNDSPGELAGLTNTPEDLQAATKFYVDNTSYSAENALFVSTKGDDYMRGVPAGKEGTSFSYAYSTINAAAKRADEMQRAAEAEPGPYMQTITIDNGAKPSTVIPLGESARTGIIDSRFDQARTLIELNREFIIREVTGYLNFEFPDFGYEIETCERDLGLILDAIAFDINKSVSDVQNNANSLTRRAAEKYYGNASGRIAITRQLTETVAAINKAKEIVAAILVNRSLKQSAILNVAKGAITKIQTSIAHGLETGNIITVRSVQGMTELNDNFYYIRVTASDQFELYIDQDLQTAVDSTVFDDAIGGNVSLAYQTDNKQFFDPGNDAASPAQNGVSEKFDLVTNIMQNGIDAGQVTNYGRPYRILLELGENSSTDQAAINNRDIIPGKILVGKISGAQGRIVNYYDSEDLNNPETSGNYDVIEINLLKPIDFIANEDLEYGNFVNRKQITIFVESGQYEEDYPIRISQNVSLKGDEFRRVIVRPKERVSQSPWASTYIYRDREFDGIELTTSGARFYNQTNEWQGHFGYHYLSNPEKELNVGIAVNNTGGYAIAADILKENTQFIQREVIAYIQNNTSSLLYDHAQFELDFEKLMSAVTYDIILGTNYNAVTQGLKFQRDKTIYKSSQLKELWVVGLTRAKQLVGGLPAVVATPAALNTANASFDEIINIISTGEMDTDVNASTITFASTPTTTSADQNALDHLVNNKEFIAQELLAYINQITPYKFIDENIRLRDFRNLVDALSYDIYYGNNSAIVNFVKGLFYDEDDSLRLEITTQAETIETLDHLKIILGDILLGNTIVTTTEGNTETQDTSAAATSAAVVTEAETLINIIQTQILNENTLDLGVANTPPLTNLTQGLLDAKSNIDGSYTSIEASVITTIDSSPEAVFTFNTSKCRRDVGLIVEAMASDLETGGDEQVTEVQGQYYTSYIQQYNNGGFGGQENVTKGAIEYIATIADRLFSGSYDVGLQEQTPGDSTYVEPDFKYGVAETAVTDNDLAQDFIDKIIFAFSRSYNPPKRNDEMDVFLMNDATILRNLTCQGHGGFLCVLDPDGQILTKSPYIQTGSSFSKSINKKIFGGGMFVDAYAGNLPVYIPETLQVAEGQPAVPGKIDNFTLWIQSEPGQGLFIREPQLPCPFYVEGRRYQVNAISDYSQGKGWCKIYLDTNSNNGVGYDENDFNERVITLSSAHSPALGEQVTQANSGTFATVSEIKPNGDLVLSNIVGTLTSNPADTLSGSITGNYNAYPSVIQGLKERPIYLQTAGNRSMLGNDFTQINDLGYGLVTNNGAFSEMVSMFTYYCQAAYYAKNGSEIRSLNGSNGYGFFGLVAEGADPNEIPDQVLYNTDMAFPTKTYRFITEQGVTPTFSNEEGANAIFVTDAPYAPPPNSIVEIPHGGEIGTKRYRISAVSEYNTGSEPTPTGGVYTDTVYRLQITGRTDGENGDFYGTLQAEIPDGTYLNFRASETHQFSGIRDRERLVNRPSTAINFDESDDITYRSITFAGADNYGNDLPNDTILTTFNIAYDHIELSVDADRLSGGNGSSPGDTTIAVRADGDSEGRNQIDAVEAARLTLDIAGRQPGETNYAGGMIFAYQGRTHQILDYYRDTTNISSTNFVTGKEYEITALGTTDWNNVAGTSGITYSVGDTFFAVTTASGTGTATDVGAYFIDIDSTPRKDITPGGSGLSTAMVEGHTIYTGLPTNTTAEITISISLCRATGHDFTQIGTGSFNDSNYPNVLLGDPVNPLAEFYSDQPTSTSAQVWERRKGRVFWMSTDQYGFFRVGQFFSVDQAQGSIRFSGEIGITGANELGFRKGVTVDEFSIDDTMADESDTAVPVEKAIVSYVNKRLGRDKNDVAVSGKLGPGFLPLSGTAEMFGTLRMGSNRIANLGYPANNSDAANKQFVVDTAAANDTFEILRETSVKNPVESDILIYTGLRKILCKVPVDELGSDTFAVNDEIVAGTTTGIVKDYYTVKDDIVGEAEPGQIISVIVYELTSEADFELNETVSGTDTKADVTTQILKGPFDELAHAKNGSSSVIEYTTTRTPGVLGGENDALAEFNFQIVNGSVRNADIAGDAAIQQSKLLMNKAAPLGSAANLFGGAAVDTGQAQRGLAAFDSDYLTHEIELTLTGTITVAQGDYLYQGTNVGVVVADRENNTKCIIRTSDPWAANSDILAKISIEDGVFQASVALGVSVLVVEASGYIGLKERSFGFDRFNQITSKNLLGRSERDLSPDIGDVEAVTFATVVDQGLGLQDLDFDDSEVVEINGQRLSFNTEVTAVNGETISQGNITGTVQGSVFGETEIYVVNVVNDEDDPANFVQGTVDGSNPIRTVGTVVSVNNDFDLIGQAMIKIEDGVYGTTSVSTVSAGNSIARRTPDGSLQATSIVVGGGSSQKILAVSGTNIVMTTPDGGEIFRATGSSSSKPTMVLKGNITVGEVGSTAANESTLHEGSIWGTTGGAIDPAIPGDVVTTQRSALAARWVYTNFIEALTEKDNTSTGIGLGAGTQTSSSADNVIALITNGVEKLVVKEDIIDANVDLTIRSGADFKILKENNSDSAFLVDGTNGNTTIAGTCSSTGNMSTGGTLTVTSSATFGGGYGSTGVTISNAGNISANGNITVDGNLTVSGITTIGSDNTDTVAINATVSTNVVPSATGKNLGSSGTPWSTVYGNSFSGTATTAKYADLAENYLADSAYEPGTVVVLGGEAEVTLTNSKGDHRVAGIVSTDPAHLMNSGLEGDNVVAVALQGRVPCKVLGRVSKGDILVTSAIPGYACVNNNPTIGTILGKAIENKIDDSKGVVEVLVGKS